MSIISSEIDHSKIWSLYADDKVRYKFYNILYEKRIRNGKCTFEDIMSNSRGDIFDNQFLPKLKYIMEICEKLGLNHSQENKDIIERNLLEQIEDEKIIYGSKLFKYRDRRPDKTTWTARQKYEVLRFIFNTWGFSEINSHKQPIKKSINKKEVYITPYCLKGDSIYDFTSINWSNL